LKAILEGGISMAANPDLETRQPTYDHEFLESIRSAAACSGPKLAPGERKVICSVAEAQSTGLRERLFSSQLKPGNYEVTLDTSDQVLRLDIPEDYKYDFRSQERSDDPPLYPSFAEAGLNASKFAPAALLALKAKQFDDGLHACVEMAADAGFGCLAAKKDFLLRLLHALAKRERTAASILTAAARFGGQQVQVSTEVADHAESMQREFLADELRSKVVGFYTWNEELARVFRCDRMLQTEIQEAAARAIATVLSGNDELLSAYTSHLRLAEQLTNPLARADLRELSRALKEGRTTDCAPGVSLFPPSRSHETELINKLYRDRPIPEAFDLAGEMVKRLRAGTLDLKPNPASGWYDHQAYALQPLAVPEATPEAKYLSFDESYRKELAGLFKALLALTRETHVKQLELPPVGSAMGARPVKVKFYIAPDLSLEPLATYYLRRAHSYQFVREVLERAFGREGLDKMRRLTADGPVNLPLGEEIQLIQALFHGAYLQACGEIGMTPGPEPHLGNGEATNSHRAMLKAWLASVRRDPDLGKDVRTMVPIFYDLGRQKTKVWIVLGIATKRLRAAYATPPMVTGIKGPDRRDVKSSDFEVNFTVDYHQTAYFATAEVYVTRLLDRAEFREHCARHKTYRAIISNLQ
jgi:hypothetical protein